MAKSKLKGWVKYDSSKRLVAGILLIRPTKPAGKGWVQVNYELCCNSDTEE